MSVSFFYHWIILLQLSLKFLYSYAPSLVAAKIVIFLVICSIFTNNCSKYGVFCSVFSIFCSIPYCWLLQIDLRQQDEDIPFIDRLSVIHGVSPGWMPSLAARAAGIRSLFLKPSSRLSTSGKAVGCKVRLRLIFHIVRFLLSGSVLRWSSGIADADSPSGIAPCSTPLPAMSALDAPCRRCLVSATARSRPDLPRLRLACSRPR